jgi:hypothetical protein
VKKRHRLSRPSEPAPALNSDATPKIVRLASSNGLRPTLSPIGPAESAPAMMPMLDHRNAVVNAGGGRCQTWISDGTAQAIELMSNPSHICTSVHNAATRICKPPIAGFRAPPRRPRTGLKSFSASRVFPGFSPVAFQAYPMA